MKMVIYGKIIEAVKNIVQATSKGFFSTVKAVINLFAVILKSVIKKVGPLSVILAIIGYFVYGGWTGCLGIILLSFILGWVCALGLIPILGPILYWLIATKMVIPWIFNLTGIYATGLTGFIYWLYFALSIVMGIVGAIIIFMIVMFIAALVSNR